MDKLEVTVIVHSGERTPLWRAAYRRLWSEALADQPEQESDASQTVAPTATKATEKRRGL